MLPTFSVPRADTIPVKKEKKKEAKNPKIQVFAKLVFSFVFKKVYYFCKLVHLVVHLVENKLYLCSTKR